MVNTLTKFGVPTGGSTNRGGILQPKYPYKFRLFVNNFGPLAQGLDFTRQVVSADRPKPTFDGPIEVHSYNSRSYLIGKHAWNGITVTLRDDITNSISRLVGHQLQKQTNFFEMTSPTAGVNYKFTMALEILDGGDPEEGDGEVLEHWDIEGAYVTDVNYGTLDYSNTSDIMTIELSIQYDNATLADGLFPETVQEISGSTVA